MESDALKKISIRIEKDGAVIGSGCLLPGQSETFYCLTARHCLVEENDGVREFRLKRYDEKSGGYVKLPYSEFFLDEEHDAAILKVDYSKGEYPVGVYPGKRSGWDSKVCISGYPMAADGCLVPVLATINAPASSDDRITIHMDNTYEKYGELELNGLSGGGCFVEKKRGLKLIGIEKEFAVEKQFQAALNCTDIEVYQGILRKHHMPLLQIRREYINLDSPGIKQVSPVPDKLGEPEFRNQWVDASFSETLKKNVCEYFERGEGAFLIYGTSGIGKTRTALEVCRDTYPFFDALIFESFRTFQKFRNELSAYKDTAYLIVDDVTLADWREIDGLCHDCPNLRIVCISGELETETVSIYGGRYLLHLETCTDDDVKRLISVAYPGLNERDMELVVKFSGHDLRFALLLAELFRNDPAFMEKRWTKAGICTAAFAARAVIERRLTRVNSDNPHSPEQVANAFSMFLNFGMNPTPADELGFISNYFGIDQYELEHSAEEFSTQRLGVIRDNYFELSPRALARILFTECHDAMIRRGNRTYGEFMDKIPSDEMRKSFLLRVSECGEKVKKEVEGKLFPWFQKKYAVYRVSEFAQRAQSGSIQCSLSKESARFSVDEAMMYVEFFPETGLPWLVQLVNNSSPNELRDFTGYHKGRREILWMCQRLASFQEYFYQCEEILFRLAIYESEKGLSDNSQRTWGELFEIFLSGTQTPFPEKLELLISRMKYYQAEWDAQALEAALTCMLSWNSTRILPPKMVGGRLVPEDWARQAIKTSMDLFNIHKEILRKFKEQRDAFPDMVREILFTKLLEQVHFYPSCIDDDIPKLYWDTLCAYMETEENRLQVLREIDAALDLLDYSEKEEKIRSKDTLNRQKAYLYEWRHALASDTLSERLRLLLQGSVMFGLSIDRTKEELPRIAEEVLTSGQAEPLMRATLQVFGLNGYSVYSLALILGERDCNGLLFALAKERFMDGDGNFSAGYFHGMCRDSMPGRIREVLDEALSRNPTGTLGLTLSIDISQEGYVRILKALDAGGITNYYLLLALREKWFPLLTRSQMWEILSRLERNIANDNLYILYHISREWFYQTNENRHLEAQLFLQMLSRMTPEHRCITDVDFEYRRLLEALRPFDAKACLKLTIEDVEFRGREARQSLAFLESHVAQDGDRETVFEICNRLLEPVDASLFHPPFHTLTLNLPTIFVTEWIEQDVRKRAACIAFHLPSPSREKADVPEITRVILGRYGNDDGVIRRFLVGAHGFRSFQMSELEALVEREEAVLREYDKDKNRAIRLWAEEERRTLQDMLKDKERWDAPRTERFDES